MKIKQTETFKKESLTPERVAMNIVYQIGDDLFERGLVTVEDRQETNDKYIDFATKLISELINQSK